MDSLTQIVLGSSVAAVSAPAHQRRPAILAGAILGTLPDLDVIWFKLAGSDAITQVTWHRGPSHSLFVLTLLGFALWLLGRRYSPLVQEAPRRWLWLVLLALLTHPLLDAFTVYGTQLFWPLPWSPVMGASIFIIDPLYTLPLLVGVIRAWQLSPGTSASDLWRIGALPSSTSADMMLARYNPQPGVTRWLALGLVLSSLYLGWSVHAKLRADQDSAAQLADMNLQDAPRIAIPLPFNTLNWRIIVMAPDGYWLGDRFLFSGEKIDFRFHPSETAALKDIESDPQIGRLLWFNHGFVGLRTEPGRDGAGQRLILSDLRMGLEPDYFFQYHVADQQADGSWKTLPLVTRRRD